MEEKDMQQTIDIAVLKRDIEHIKESVDSMLESQRGMFEMFALKTDLARIETDFNKYRNAVREELQNIAVLRTQVELQQKIVYGAAGFILTAFLAAVAGAVFIM